MSGVSRMLDDRGGGPRTALSRLRRKDLGGPSIGAIAKPASAASGVTIGDAQDQRD